MASYPVCSMQYMIEMSGSASVPVPSQHNKNHTNDSKTELTPPTNPINHKKHKRISSGQQHLNAYFTWNQGEIQLPIQSMIQPFHDITNTSQSMSSTLTDNKTDAYIFTPTKSLVDFSNSSSSAKLTNTSSIKHTSNKKPRTLSLINNMSISDEELFQFTSAIPADVITCLSQVSSGYDLWRYIDRQYFTFIQSSDMNKLNSIIDTKYAVRDEDYVLIDQVDINDVAKFIKHHYIDNVSDNTIDNDADDSNSDSDNDEDNQFDEIDDYSDVTSIAELTELLNEQIAENQRIATELHQTVCNTVRAKLIRGKTLLTQLQQQQMDDTTSKTHNKPVRTVKQLHDTGMHPQKQFNELANNAYMSYLKLQRKLNNAKLKAIKISEDDLGQKVSKTYTGANNSAVNSIHRPISEGIVCCSVCNEDDAEDDNEIMYCDMCDLAVHQICYGVQQLPVNEWYCDVCTINRIYSLCVGSMKQGCTVFKQCTICCQRGGAMKLTEKYAQFKSYIDQFYKSTQPIQLTVNQYNTILNDYDNIEFAHLICALYVNEAYIGNPDLMQPICNIPRINKQRYTLRCTICHAKGIGACIQCCSGKCTTSYHASCARHAGYQLGLIEDEHGKIAYNSYCERHRKVKSDQYIIHFDNINPNNVNNPFLELSGKPMKLQRIKPLPDKIRNSKQFNQLAKQLFNRTYRMQYHHTCDVCSIGYQTQSIATESNLLVQCKTCKLEVHQQCYGILSSRLYSIYKNGYECDVCIRGTRSTETMCVMCGSHGGAMKLVEGVDSAFCHIHCALFIPELSFVNVDTMTPIAGCQKAITIYKQLRCTVCQLQNVGVCVQCSYSKCVTAVHVTCAISHCDQYVLVERSGRSSKRCDFVIYCSQHNQCDQALQLIDAQEQAQAITREAALTQHAQYQLAANIINVKSNDKSIKFIVRDDYVSSDSDDDTVEIIDVISPVKTKQNKQRSKQQQQNTTRKSGASNMLQYLHRNQNERENIVSSDDDMDDGNGQLYCVCRQPYNPLINNPMIGCDECEEWYHAACLGLKVTDYEGDRKFVCPRCVAEKKLKKRNKK